MSGLKFGSGGLWSVGALLSLVLLAAPASSRPNATAEPPAIDQLLQRVLILEERVHFLQRQVDKLQHGQVTEELQAGGWLKEEEPDCAMPFIEDKSGIRRARPECAKALQALDCEPPFAVTGDGVKRMKGECLPDLGGSSCEPPFSLDAAGVKRFSIECLNAR